MTRIIYFDCFSGASGDMIIGALLDAGLDFEALKKSLAGLNFHGYQLTAEKVLRSSITATKFNVVLDEEEHEHHHESCKDRHYLQFCILHYFISAMGIGYYVYNSWSFYYRLFYYCLLRV